MHESTNIAPAANPKKTAPKVECNSAGSALELSPIENGEDEEVEVVAFMFQSPAYSLKLSFKARKGS